MFKPAAQDPRFAAKKGVSTPFNIPPPTGGLNARDAFTEMPPQDAVALTNAFPEANYVTARGGSAAWRSGQTSPARSLMTWQGLTGTDKLLMGASASIFDVSAAGSSPTPVQTSLASVDFQWTNFENSAGIFLVLVNGADPMRTFDGTNWVTQTVTGVSSSTFANVCQFKQRLWFSAVNSLDVWFLGLQSISGAATDFPLGAVFRKGGYVTGIGTFSQDAGDGPNEYLCFVTSNGEIAVYEGTDPTNANTWALVGVYNTGLPIGRRCVTRWDGDMAILTQDGIVSMQATLQFDRNADQKAAITAKIQTLFSLDAQQYKQNFGWMMQLYPHQRYLIVNIPAITNMSQSQLVMNTITGAWCQFQGLNAGCWGVANDQLYFGGNDGTVYQANVGYQDQGSAINWELQTSWQIPGGPTNKLFTMVRPTLLVGAGVTYAIALNVDFQATIANGFLAALSSGAASMVWSWKWPGTWGGQNILDQRWQTAGAIGTWASVQMAGTTTAGGVEINAFQVLAQPGGPL